MLCPVSLPPMVPVLDGWEADLFHLGGPFLVVIAAARWFAKVLLPKMRHLVHER
jgi:hypothetical protein